MNRNYSEGHLMVDTYSPQARQVPQLSIATNMEIQTQRKNDIKNMFFQQYEDKGLRTQRANNYKISDPMNFFPQSCREQENPLSGLSPSAAKVSSYGLHFKSPQKSTFSNEPTACKEEKMSEADLVVASKIRNPMYTDFDYKTFHNQQSLRQLPKKLPRLEDSLDTLRNQVEAKNQSQIAPPRRDMSYDARMNHDTSRDYNTMASPYAENKKTVTFNKGSSDEKVDVSKFKVSAISNIRDSMESYYGAMYNNQADAVRAKRTQNPVRQANDYQMNTPKKKS